MTNDKWLMTNEGILSILKLSNDGAQRLPQLVISH